MGLYGGGDGGFLYYMVSFYILGIKFIVKEGGEIGVRWWVDWNVILIIYLKESLRKNLEGKGLFWKEKSFRFFELVKIGILEWNKM